MLLCELRYGIRNEKVVSIWDLEERDRGLACDCVCPCCGEKLLAKLGKKKTRHFAHRNSNCSASAANQTALHLLAKEILQEEKKFLFPPVTFAFEQTKIYKSNEKYYEGQKYFRAPNSFNDITPSDFSDSMPTTSVKNDPFSDFGSSIEINDDELPF